MRTDVTIDKKQVTCPNASTIGFDKRVAKVGNLIITDGGMARMIGRIASAPACGETPAIKNWILAVALSQDMTHMMERWINPANVTRVFEVGAQPQAFAEFIGNGLISSKTETVRAAASQLWSTVSDYLRYRSTIS